MQKNPENEYGPIDNTRLEKYMKIFRENGFKIPRTCMTDDDESVSKLKIESKEDPNKSMETYSTAGSVRDVDPPLETTRQNVFYAEEIPTQI